MKTKSTWRRAGASALVVASVLSAGCDRIREDLLAAEDPDIINPSTVTTAEAADALRIGALARFRSITAGSEGTWQDGGLLVDEWKSSNTFFQHNETDQRQEVEVEVVVGDEGPHPFDPHTGQVTAGASPRRGRSTRIPPPQLNGVSADPPDRR